MRGFRRTPPTFTSTPFAQADRPVRIPVQSHQVRICGTELDGSFYFHCRTCNASGGATPDRAVAVAAGREHGDVK